MRDSRKLTLWLAGLSLLAGLLGAGFFSVERGLFLSARDRAILPLVRAVGPRRFFEPRLDADFQYGPVISPRRSAAPGSSEWAVLAAAADIKARALTSHGLAERRALAYAHFVLNDPSPGVAILQELISENPGDGGLHSDLAAGYLLRAKAAGWAEDLPRSLDHAVDGVRLAPRSDQARFNLALAQAGSGLLKESLASLMAISPVRGWEAAVAEEAARIRSQLHEQVARSESDGGVLHDDFEKALADPASKQSLSLSDLARAYEDLTGDSSLRITISDPDANSPRSEAYRDYGAAREAYARNEISSAMARFRRVESRLQGPFKLWASHYLAIGEYFEGSHAAARERLLRIHRLARQRGYLRLQARCSWMLGLLALVRGDYGTALREYESALNGFIRLRDRMGEASVVSLYAEAASWTGQRDLAWKLRVKAVARLTDARDWKREQAALIAAAILASDAGLANATFQYHERAVSIARARGDRLALADALLFGMEFAEKFRSPDAVPRAREVLELSSRLDASVARRVNAEVTLRLPLSMARDPGVALADRLESAARFYEGAEGSPPQRAQLVDVEMRRALLAESLGDAPTAARRFTAAADRISDLSASMRPDERITLMETAEVAFTRSLESRGEAPALTLAAEIDFFRCRRYHNDASCRRDALAVLRERIPAGVCLLQIVPTQRETVLIEVSAGRARLESAPVPQNLDRLAATALGALEREDESGARRAARQFGEQLLGPFRLSADCRRVGVQAFGVAARLPPGLLWLSGSSDPLGITIEVAQVTSVAFPRSAPAHKTPLVVAQARPPAFAPLPYAEIEAQQVAGALGVKAVARSLTKEEFLAMLSRSGALHFAGHSVPDPRDPLRSFLVLGGVDDQASYVFGYEIARLDLRHMGQVVLSSCNAGAGSPESRRASLGLAGAFMAAGVRAVEAPVVSVVDRPLVNSLGAWPPSSGERPLAGVIRLAYVRTTRWL